MRRLLAAVVVLAASTATNATASPVVAVLYFDNNTNDPSLDVLKKGLADMMVTDLASGGLTVVERDRLEALLSELKLQRTSYFDQKTAVRIGKGLGAKYAVTGAIAAMAPEIRLDIRLIDIETAKVVVADRMTGHRDKFFDLQRRLAERFIAGIDTNLRYRPSLGLKVPDVNTLMSYAEGVDLADAGQVDEAKKRLKALVKRKPAFGLARQRVTALEQRLSDARTRRTDIRSDAASTLQARAEAFLETHPDITKLDKNAAEHALGYRAANGAFIARALRGVLSKGRPALVLSNNEKNARKLIDAYVANAEKIMADYDRAIVAHRNISAELDDDGERLAAQFDMKTRYGQAAERADEHLAEFLLLGKLNTYANEKGRFEMAPPPSVLVRKYEDVGRKLAERAMARGNDHERARSAEILGEWHLLRAEPEKAVEAFQWVLDTFPTHRRFAFYERRIKEVLGLKRDHTMSTRARYKDALTDCKDMDFRVGVSAELKRRVRVAGIAAVPAVIDELIERCKATEKRNNAWRYVFEMAASYGAEHGVCPLWESMMRRYLSAGGFPKSVARYHEKKAPQCQDVSKNAPKPLCWWFDYSQLKPTMRANWIQRALPAAGQRTAPRGHWYNKRDWFAVVHPKQHAERCRAVIQLDFAGTPENARATVRVIRGPKTAPYSLKLGDIRRKTDDESRLDPVWTRVAWKLYPPNLR